MFDIEKMCKITLMHTMHIVPVRVFTLKEITMKTEQIAQAIANFAINLQGSTTMEERRDSVEWLAEEIGSTAANKIADIFGLTDEWYKA